MRLSFRHRVSSGLCVAVWLLGPGDAAQAQAEATTPPPPPAEATAPPPPPAEPKTPPAEATAALPATDEAAHTHGSVVFLLAPDLHPAVAAGLNDALEAQLSGTGTAIYWDTLAAPSTDLRAAIEQGKPAAAEHQAAGVFWLDASGANDWLLYLMDAAGERILARRMENAADAPTASIEAIAVIVRESAVALIAGRPIAMDPVATTPPPPAPTPTRVASAPAPAPVVAPTNPTVPDRSTTDEPSALRVAIGYAGSPLSTDVPWQHGLALQASLFSSVRTFVGLAYTLLPTLDVSAGGVGMTLHRRPIRLLAGYALPLGAHLRLDFEAAAILDVATRTTRTVPSATDPAGDDTATIFGAGLGARLNVIPQPNVELYLSLGGEGFFNRFQYVVDRDEDITLLSPWSLTPAAEIGVAFRP